MVQDGTYVSVLDYISMEFTSNESVLLGGVPLGGICSVWKCLNLMAQFCMYICRLVY